MDPGSFSSYIKDRRHELGLSLKEASRRTGIQPSRLHDLEQGRNSTTGKPTEPTRENITLLSKGYQLSREFLFELAGHSKLDPDTIEEKQLLSHFRGLQRGHRRAVLTLVDELYQMDRPPS